MTPTITTMRLRYGLLDDYAKRLALMVGVVALLVTALLLLSPGIVSAFVGLGGYISEKVLGDGTGEVLFLGDGVSENGILGSGPVVSTLLATDVTVLGGTPTATLHGDLTDLNGMPRASTWFIWGYSPVAMVNSTAPSTVTVTGVVSTALTGFNANQTVYFQFQAGTDGTSIGSVRSFSIGGGTGGWLLESILPTVLAVAILVAVLLLTGNPILALVYAVSGMIAFYVVQASLNML